MPKNFILKTRVFHERQDFRREESGGGTSSTRFNRHVPTILMLHKSCVHILIQHPPFCIEDNFICQIKRKREENERE